MVSSSVVMTAFFINMSIYLMIAFLLTSVWAIYFEDTANF